VRSGRVAEAVLSLVAPAERAASAVGDLMEDAGTRRRVWFWWAVARLAISLLGRDLLFAPLAMAACSAIAWFLYMALSVALALVAYVAVTVVWGIAYVLSQHTGLELLVDVLRIRFDWPPILGWTTYGIQAVVLLAVAPFQVGRGSARHWRGHELSLVIVMLLTWSIMAVLVPLVGVGIRATPSMMPVVVAFVLAGLLSDRRRPATAG